MIEYYTALGLFLFGASVMVVVVIFQIFRRRKK